MTTYGYLPWPPGLANAKDEPFSSEEGFEDGSDECNEEEKEEGDAEDQAEEQTEEDGKEEPWPPSPLKNGHQAMQHNHPICL